MRDSPVVTALAVVVFIVGAAALAAFVKSRSQPVHPATPKIIACDPWFFEGKLVRLKVSSMEEGRDVLGGRELRYREDTSKPFVVFLRGNLPAKLPETIDCFCEEPKNGITVLTVR